MEDFDAPVVVAILAVLVLVAAFTFTVTSGAKAGEARRCTTWYRAAATAQDSLAVASKGCEWLLVPAKE